MDFHTGLNKTKYIAFGLLAEVLYPLLRCCPKFYKFAALSGEFHHSMQTP